MTRVDAHLHVWDLARASYPWLGPELAPLDRDHALDEVLPELRTAGIDAVVLVQAADNDDDTAVMLATADHHAEVAGVVGWLPLERPEEVARRLADGLDPRIVGIRALIHDMPDPEWILGEAVTRSLALLADAGLSYDVVTASPAALRLVPELARRHPELSIVVDHLGKPPVGGPAHELAEWRALLAAAAAHPRVSAKLSGLTASVGASDGVGGLAVLRPIVDAALEAFGPARLMYGGDWPISRLAGRYDDALRALRQLLDALGDTESAAVFGDTAIRIYRLEHALLTASATQTPDTPQ